MRDLYIIGAGAFGRETAWVAERMNEARPTWNIRGFIDDDPQTHGKMNGVYPVLGGCDVFDGVDGPVWAVCAIGTSGTRKKVIEKLKGYANVNFATLIDPSVIQGARSRVGQGVILCAGTILAVDSVIGDHVIINFDCTIGHDAVVHDYVTINPSVNLSGFVDAGECSEFGTGTHVIQGKRIGAGSIVGAGAVVIRDIPEKCTAVGNPAKPIKFFA